MADSQTNDEHLEAFAVNVSAVVAAEVVMVTQLADLWENDQWGGGCRTFSTWVAWHTGTSDVRAATLARLAQARATHPAIWALFAAGRLTVDQAGAAVRITPERDAEWAEVVPLMTVTQIRRLVNGALNADQPTTDTERVESGSVSLDDEGWVRVRFDLDPDRGRVVDAALAAARDRIFRSDPQARQRVTWADALVDACQRSLDAEDSSRRDRFRINLYLDPTQPIGATWADGTAVPDAIRRHITCDGHLTPEFVDSGVPYATAATQRIVPDRIRRQVLHRDQARCRNPLCRNTRWLEVHHIVHWEDHGPTLTPNLVSLCSACHRDHHRGLLGITGNADRADGLTFADANGRPIEPPAIDVAAVPPPPPSPLVPRPYRHPLGGRVDWWTIVYNPLHLRTTRLRT